MKRAKKSRGDLRVVSDDLYYEFFQFDRTARGLTQGWAGDSRVLNNALIESLGIHARNLLHFFYPPKSVKEADVLADDFFKDENTWQNVRPPVDASWIASFCDRVSKRIAHISYARVEVSSDDRDWGVHGERAYDVISQAFQTFIKLVPDDTLGAEMKREKRQSG